MPPLSCLTFPQLTPELLALLNAHGVYKVEDLLTKDLYSLPGLGGNSNVIWALDSLGSLEALTPLQKALRDLLNEVYARYGSRSRTGQDLFRMVRQARFIQTGCDSIDNLLKGGLRRGTITEIVGPTATGKTQLCHQAAACAALRHRVGVAYVDTTCSFVALRLVNMLGGLARADNLEDPKAAGLAALSSVVRMTAHDIHALLALLDDINFRMRSQSEAPASEGSGGRDQQSPESGVFNKLGLLIVDSSTAVISPILGAGTQSKQGHTLMRCLGQSLKEIAVTHNIAVLVTNGTVADGQLLKPALGESWKNVAHVYIRLDRDPLSDISSAHLKHCVLGNGVFETETYFRLGRNGLHPSEPRQAQDVE